MTRQRHEIPTHLNVEDKAFFGLSVRQVMELIVGCSAGYALFTQWPQLPFSVRIGIAVGCVLVAAVLGLIRPRDRGLEEWIFVGLHYVATPKVSVWRQREPEIGDWRAATGRWEEIAPELAWKEPEP